MFEINQTPVEVVRRIVSSNEIIQSIQIFGYDALHINWRQKHRTSISKVDDIERCFVHHPPIKTLDIPREELNDIQTNDYSFKNTGMTWAFNSPVKCSDGIERHIPMMNFHPEIPKERDPVLIIMKAMKFISGDKEGAILKSGRFYHYYGNYLLSHNEWLDFISKFLMTCVLISPRYIGHSIHDRSTPLRFTGKGDGIQNVPNVIEVLG